MEQRHAHPLDSDLLSVALGDTNVAVDSDINEHLSTCLLCRIRIARIRRGNATPEPLNATGIQYPSVSPEVLAVFDSTIERGEAQAGQLWLAGDTYRIPVWIDDIEDGIAFVYAASLDTDAADDTALITPVPNLDRPLAVYTSVGGTIGIDRLVSYIDDLPIHDDVERLVAAAVNGTVADGLLTGSAITGVTDERLELRQLLADDLAALDPIDDDGDDEPDDDNEPALSAVGGLADHLRHDLLWRRGPRCRVHDIDETVAQLSAPMAVATVATVHELGCVVLIVSGERGPQWALDHAADAWTLMEAATATVLGFAEPTDPYDTVLFERHDLRDSYELPRAGLKSPPRIAVVAQPIVKALHTYLDKSAFEVHPADPVERPSVAPDLSPHLHANAHTSIASLKGIGAQTGKKRALKALSNDDAKGIADALSGTNDLDSLLAKIEQVLEQ
jgi:hypothetical protein